MPSLASCVKHVFVLWIIASGISMAHETPHLKVDPDRIRNAREKEQKARSMNDSLLLAEAWYLYGKAYVFAADYHTAQDYFLKSLRIHEPKGNSFELSRLYVRLCENEERLGHIKQGLYYATLALQVAEHIDREKDQALIRSYGALAHTYESIWGGKLPEKRSDYDKALYYYAKREALCKKVNDTSGIAEVSLELGSIYTRAKDPRAIPYLENALDLFTRKNKDGIRINTMIHLAAAYLTFGKPKQAILALNDAEKLYKRKNLNEYEISLMLEDNFVRYYETLGQWQRAFEHLRKLDELERIKLLSDRDGAITRLGMEYGAEKKEALLKAKNQQIALQNQNLLTQERFTYATTALLLMAVGMSIVFFRLYRKNQRISHRNEVLLKEQNHRVKNNLQIISSLLNLQAKRLTDEAAKKAVEESRLRVQSMAIIHRKLYDGDKLAEVNLNLFIKELTEGVLNAFGYLAVKTEFAIDDINLSADKAISLGLILNELITNACKYAFPENESPFLRITCHRKNNRIELKVEDNGPGLEGPGLAELGAEQVKIKNVAQERSGGSGSSRINGQSPVLQANGLLASQTESFGMTLIQAQVDQLYGTYRFSSRDKTVAPGTVFIMEFKS